VLALNPAAILIDHGHFQYNGISLGCTAGAAAAIVSGRDLFGSFLFCLAGGAVGHVHSTDVESTNPVCASVLV
jgi:hypothetical protein